MSLKEKEFVEVGEVLGYKSSRLIVKHILPNILSTILVISTANFSAAILLESGLWFFLGLGAQTFTSTDMGIYVKRPLLFLYLWISHTLQ